MLINPHHTHNNFSGIFSIQNWEIGHRLRVTPERWTTPGHRNRNIKPHQRPRSEGFPTHRLEASTGYSSLLYLKSHNEGVYLQP